MRETGNQAALGATNCSGVKEGCLGYEAKVIITGKLSWTPETEPRPRSDVVLRHWGLGRNMKMLLLSFWRTSVYQASLSTAPDNEDIVPTSTLSKHLSIK